MLIAHTHTHTHSNPVSHGRARVGAWARDRKIEINFKLISVMVNMVDQMQWKRQTHQHINRAQKVNYILCFWRNRIERARARAYLASSQSSVLGCIHMCSTTERRTWNDIFTICIRTQFVFIILCNGRSCKLNWNRKVSRLALIRLRCLKIRVYFSFGTSMAKILEDRIDKLWMEAITDDGVKC